METKINLSPSKLNLFNECPRCFWDAYAAKCPKPRGIFPSLPGGMDLILKAYFDKFRGDLPPSLKGKVTGKLFEDMAALKRWRHWRTSLSYFDQENNITLIGALDDCVVDGKAHVPLDYKTKGSCPKDDGSQYYQTQLDCYNLMLSASGYETQEEGYLVYFYPKLAGDYPNTEVLGIAFGIETFKISCSIERAKEIIAKATECLRGKRPQSALTCEHCKYLIMEDNLTTATKERSE